MEEGIKEVAEEMEDVQKLRTSPVVSPIRPTVGMTFAECLQQMLGGGKYRRKEWTDDGTHVMLKDEKLMIWLPKDKTLHPMIVSSGDIAGEDWVIVK